MRYTNSRNLDVSENFFFKRIVVVWICNMCILKLSAFIAKIKWSYSNIGYQQDYYTGYLCEKMAIEKVEMLTVILIGKWRSEKSESVYLSHCASMSYYFIK